MLSAVTGRSLQLVGGAPCLDFVNTIDPRLKPPQEDFLMTFEQLARWGHYVGLLTAAEEKSLIAAGARDASFAADVHGRALALREALYRLLRPADRRPATALRVVNEELARTAPYRVLASADDGYRLAWRKGAAHERLLGTLSQSACDLLTSTDYGRVRECAGDGCGWLFLDTSKAHRRRWCSMAICGNRVKARRHRDRRSRGVRHTAGASA